MNLLSNPSQDVRHRPHSSGGYEWWYFDGRSLDERFSFVIIFYEGNSFSTRYNGALLDGKSAMPAEYPAISISVYENGNPIYYSFTEFDSSDCSFSEEAPLVEIGPHRMEEIGDDQKLIYKLDLDETLASGDQLEGTITFESLRSQSAILESDQQTSAGHTWNLVQPRADVQAVFTIQGIRDSSNEIQFQGRGYHDHNTGREPMHKEFTDWYWGRFHFDSATLVYYVMNHQDEKQHQAWLISKNNAELLHTFDQVDLADNGFTLFGLQPYRKIGLRSDEAEIQVQHRQVVDNGPFYQRYHSDAFLRVPDSNIVEQQQGISEYLYPDRINARVFWPFVNMRIRYKTEKPHWVQRSKMLYRWTW